MREISAGIIIYRKTTRGVKFLLLYHGGGYWNFPKGKIESAERSWQTAVREIREETGLGLKDLRFRKQFRTYDKYFFYREKKKIFKIVVLYLAETRRSDIRVSDEHEGYAWFNHREALRVLGKYKESQRILNQANEFIRDLQRHPRQILKPAEIKNPRL